ncbi:MAG: cob(I)yrinic acid a,c-diamide adenosyltransferase [Betaproteobacteria bacterium]|nr:cob(I)yrinic acid a,c-diamide adenosyltransferase [Betaproteobacteria bacterium]
MGNRLSRIITRTGDQGMTGLANGERASKHSPRIHAIGEIDELNSTLGLLCAEPLPEGIRQMLLTIQNDLFDVGGEISLPSAKLIKKQQVEFLESQSTAFNASLPMLKEFILPGGCRSAALAHLARSVCRRAERALVACADSEKSEEETSRSEALPYLNRLSDFLFILARVLNREAGQEDVFWKKPTVNT